VLLQGVRSSAALVPNDDRFCDVCDVEPPLRRWLRWASSRLDHGISREHQKLTARPRRPPRKQVLPKGTIAGRSTPMLIVGQPDARSPRGDPGSRPGLHLVAEGSLGPPNAPTLSNGVLAAIVDDAATLYLWFPGVSSSERHSPDAAVDASDGTATIGPTMTSSLLMLWPRAAAGRRAAHLLAARLQIKNRHLTVNRLA
jgi:hypothetical protein